MKKYLLLFFLFTITSPLFSQKGSAANSSSATISNNNLRESVNVNVTIFPVPVRNNNFTINSDKDISYIKVTNIIGQDIFKSRFSEQKSIQVSLNNAKRGIYIITILFSDNTRIVRKIMVEEQDQSVCQEIIFSIKKQKGCPKMDSLFYELSIKYLYIFRYKLPFVFRHPNSYLLHMHYTCPVGKSHPIPPDDCQAQDRGHANAIPLRLDYS